MYILFLQVALFIITTTLILNYRNIIASKLNLFDIPNERKLHKHPIPILGGLIFFILLIEYFIFGILFNDNYLKIEYLIFPGLIFLIGIYDDINDLNPNLKLFLIGLIFYLLILFFPKFIINELRFATNNLSIATGYLNIFFTILCMLLLINSLNMIDGINGLFLGTNIIYFLYLISIYNFNINFLLFLIFIICGLFYLNCRNKFFTGDSGVYLISSIYGLLLIETYNHSLGYSDNFISIEEIFILLMIPGLDMFRLFLERLLYKKNPFKPDRNHFHHLLKKKFSDKYALIIYLFVIALGPCIYQLQVLNEVLIIAIVVIIFYSITYYLKKIDELKIS